MGNEIPMKLINLKEFNEQRHRDWGRLNDSELRPNGIACPECGSELMDSNPMLMLASNPPQLNIHCPKCNYKGYRIR
jgi:DNA-directed RNA polymerase subunit RPC12/RpoP